MKYFKVILIALLLVNAVLFCINLKYLNSMEDRLEKLRQDKCSVITHPERKKK